VGDAIAVGELCWKRLAMFPIRLSSRRPATPSLQLVENGRHGLCAATVRWWASYEGIRVTSDKGRVDGGKLTSSELAIAEDA
jgi:hypothetical protein